MCGGKNTAYDCNECSADEFYEGYLAGAKEQRTIDIDKACEILAEQFRFDSLDIEEFRLRMRGWI